MRTSVMPMRALSMAMARSQQVARATPPPAAWPATRATTGLASASMTWTTSTKVAASGPSDARSSLRSAPAENVVPVLVMTTTRTESSASARRRPASRPWTRFWLKALRRSGASRVIVATPAASRSESGHSWHAARAPAATGPARLRGGMTAVLPLDHLLVLDLTAFRAGPTAVRQLSDWGARVITVERPPQDESAERRARAPGWARTSRTCAATTSR